MKGLLVITLLLISSAVFAQQQGLNRLSPNTADVMSYLYVPLNDSTFLKLKQPDIQLDNQFYSLLQAPNTNDRYTSGKMRIKRPDFIPNMPVAPLDPFNKFYLMDLDPVVITPKDE